MMAALLVAGLAACKAFDEKLVEDEPSSSTPPPPDATDAGERDGGPGAGDAAPAPNAGTGGTGGDVVDGTSGSGAMSDGGGPVAGEGCVPNDDITSFLCPYVCPETCNGQDDDCDGNSDEGSEGALCPLQHALAACVEGECVLAECTEGYRDCDEDPATGCEIAPDDPANCGSCGYKCELLHAVAACIDGECASAGCEALYDDCDDNPNDCETQVTTLDHCAACELTCGDVANATPTCERGFCGVGECALGFGDCNGAPGDGCEQSLDAVEHCGACMNDCDLVGSVDDCVTGVCLANSCEGGFDQCDGDRANGCEPLDSVDNCGACGKRCDGSLDHVDGASCSGQTCTPNCSAGFGNCDADPFTGCETALDSVQHCQSCETVCEEDHAVMGCGADGCELVRCQTGWGDCNENIALDGCERSLNEDTTCGSCENDCTKTTDPVCSGGTCSDVDCPDPNTADCNQNGFPCEVNLLTDVANCGACGAACEYAVADPHATGSQCIDGACRPVCEPLRADCNGDYADGCERSLATLSNCSSCGMGCSIANATATCATGACRVQQCAADFADCNMDGTSCETQLNTTQNCGACGRACNLPGAVPTCAGTAGNHSCAITACSASHLADCDGQAPNGCEIDRRTSVANCGACRNDCRTHENVNTATCSSSACRYTCDGGFGDCDSGMPGCETSLRTLTNCGGCGVECSRANGGESCSTGTCVLTSCDPGYDDCNGEPDDGCEPLTTLDHCGACDTPCTIINGTGDCSSRSCKVASCNSGWADCNGDPEDGCERNINPPASGGQGPCLPDPSCTRFPYSGRDFYFCPAEKSWSAARAACQQQLLGDLVHIDDAAENAFVLSHLVSGANAWMCGSDSGVEGTWRWANDIGIFWQGAAGGTGTGYTNWSSGEPNDSNEEDCLEMYQASGKWNDYICANARDFVCEVQADLCPDDPNKANPLQCGCGNLETDSDNDGTANCNDLCPMDAGKVAPLVCGCGTPDTNTDGDSLPDCTDGCDNDANKTVPGLCGCGTADTNSDGDSQPDCNDQCPLDAARTVRPCSFDYTPSNFDPTTLDFDAAPTVVLDCQTTSTIDTTGSVSFNNWCGTAPAPIIKAQTNGPEVVIVPMQGLTVAASRTLRVIGPRPVILAVRGDVSVSGTISARGVGATPGAGGNVSCGNGTNGADGGNNNGGDEGAGGGGGGGFGNAGQPGGLGHRGAFSNGTAAGAGGGATASASTLVPLRGGCRGGKGGNGNNTGGAGGGGGGGLQIAVSGTLTLAAGSQVSASGGGALAASGSEDGGGGGGSGGGVLLEAGVVNIAAGAWITANGGGGSSGAATDRNNSAPGTDGFANNTARAPGGPGGSGGGSGGQGAASAGGATRGADGQGTGLLGLQSGAGGGGGGGGVGFVRMRGTRSCTTTGNFSPAAVKSCP